MGFFSRLLGTEDEAARQPSRGFRPQGASDDAQAVERYRYMLQTAPPETLEQAHAEAFAKLTPEQRRLVHDELAQAAPPQERAAVVATSSEDPRALARLATRAEIRQPGMMERTLGGAGMGGFGGGLFSSFAAGFVGSMVAQSFFSAMGGFGGDSGGDSGGAEEHGANGDDGNAGDAQDDDFGGGDFGDDF